ncbi:MAG: hypothetical protein H6734_26450 [Alphaproteobacteria bacterium]|nr:hypothetical protein [Alphaproteobacteria bacterium]
MHVKPPAGVDVWEVEHGWAVRFPLPVHKERVLLAGMGATSLVGTLVAVTVPPIAMIAALLVVVSWTGAILVRGPDVGPTVFVAPTGLEGFGTAVAARDLLGVRVRRGWTTHVLEAVTPAGTVELARFPSWPSTVDPEGLEAWLNDLVAPLVRDGAARRGSKAEVPEPLKSLR